MLMSIFEKSMENLVRTASEAGAPEDQVRAFLKCGYVPFPWQWEFHAGARMADEDDGPVDLGLGGARGPGKSHAALSQAGLDDCQRVPGLKGLFLRQTGVAAKESFEDLINKALRGRVNFNFGSNVLRFSNGSKILLGGFRDERDLDKYIGIEYDLIIIEELNQLSEERVRKLKGSLRTSKPNWRPRLYTSFNPGGRGHAWVKSRYILPYRNAMEKEARFFPSTYKSNPFLNKEYIEYLEGLQGDLGKAWREGEWDLFAGQYFSEWSQLIHVCAPFEIPKEWRRVLAGDYGSFNPTSVGWYAISPEGQIFRYKELYKPGLSYSEVAEQVSAMILPEEKIDYEVWDPAIWAKKGEDTQKLSGAEIYARRRKETSGPDGKEPRLIKADNDRLIGWNAVHEMLRPYELEGKLTAKLQIFSTCTEFLRTFPALIHDELRPEDVDTDGEDHAGDELRYLVMSRPSPSKTVEEIGKREFKEMIKKRNKIKQGKRLFG